MEFPVSLTLAPLFGDSMVLQQGIPVPVWGTAAPGARVTVSFRGRRAAAATADDQGRWRAEVPSLAASAEPGELVVTAHGPASADARWVAQNVLVGEVWVCSGQSNMQLPLSMSNNAIEEMAA